MKRYSKIKEKFPREIVLLKAHQCKWGKCSFCDYIEDNSTNTKEIVELNRKILENVTGEFERLEVINSASVFDFAEATISDIKKIALEKNIKELVFESHWIYRQKIDELKEYFKPINLFFKIGLESFDNDFRNNILKKGMFFEDVREVSDIFDSACLLVAIKGQTKEMIKEDIATGLKYFKRLTVNVYNNNSTPIKRDDELYKWFVEKFSYLKDEDRIELLLDINDFGVG